MPCAIWMWCNFVKCKYVLHIFEGINHVNVFFFFQLIDNFKCLKALSMLDEREMAIEFRMNLFRFMIKALLENVCVSLVIELSLRNRCSKASHGASTQAIKFTAACEKTSNVCKVVLCNGIFLEIRFELNITSIRRTRRPVYIVYGNACFYHPHGSLSTTDTFSIRFSAALSSTLQLSNWGTTAEITR